jgi:hypothetical protein
VPGDPAGTLRGERPWNPKAATARLHLSRQNLHPQRSAVAAKVMIHRVCEMASALRLVTERKTQAGFAHEETSADKPANRGPDGGLG